MSAIGKFDATTTLAKLDVYSHHVTVTNFDRQIRKVLHEFTKPFVDYTVIRKTNGDVISTPLCVYAAANAERSEWRFHINMLQLLFKHLELFGFKQEILDIEYHELYTPERCEFSVNPTFTARDYQLPLIEYVVSPGIQKIITLQTGMGKDQPLSAKIKVPGGWSTMGAMRVGSNVIARDGTTTHVTGVWPQGVRDVFKVTFADGRSTEAGAGHLWSVHRSDTSWGVRVVDTLELISLMGISKNGLFIDLCVSENSPDVAVPVDPYTLGVRLGDSHMGPSNITLNNDKFVPPEYLHGSTKQRLAVLRGLLDTVGKYGDTASFCSTSLQLAKDVQYLVRSLGGLASLRPKQLYHTYKGVRLAGHTTYIVGIRYPKPSELFQPPCKQELTPDNNQYVATLKLRVVAVEHVGHKETQCITIDHPEHLYITDDFIVTHNTGLSLLAVAQMSYRTAIVVPAKYISRWTDDLCGEDSVLQLEPSELTVVQGTLQLIQLISLGLAAELTAKVVVISAETLALWYKHHELTNGDTSRYGVAPEEFYEVLGVGTRLIDEVHQKFHLNYRQDLYSHVPKTLSLSATLESENQLTCRIYLIMFPMEIRVNNGAYDKYIDVYCLFYAMNQPLNIKYTQRGMTSYSHTAFEVNMMRQPLRLNNYLNMVTEVVTDKHANGAKSGDKALVFASTIEMCGKLVDHLSDKLSHLRVAKYTGGDKASVLKEADITVSTLGSAGTAVDIKGLTNVFCTTAIGSVQANLQAVGRLRKPRNWPEQPVSYYYFTCRDIPQHLAYHNKKLNDQFPGKVFSHGTINLPHKL